MSKILGLHDPLNVSIKNYVHSYVITFQVLGQNFMPTQGQSKKCQNSNYKFTHLYGGYVTKCQLNSVSMAYSFISNTYLPMHQGAWVQESIY